MSTTKILIPAGYVTVFGGVKVRYLKDAHLEATGTPQTVAEMFAINGESVDMSYIDADTGKRVIFGANAVPMFAEPVEALPADAQEITAAPKAKPAKAKPAATKKAATAKK